MASSRPPWDYELDRPLKPKPSATLHALDKPAIPADIKESVVGILKARLAEAERGEIDTVIVLAHHTDKDWSESASGTDRFSEAIGRMEITKNAWIGRYLRDH